MNKKQEIKNRIDLINKSEVPKGYKKEYGYIVPNDWQVLPIKYIVKQVKREKEKPSEPYWRLSVRSHAKGTFHSFVENPEQVVMEELFEVKENDLIVNITFAWEHAIAIVKKEDEGLLVSHRFPTYEFNKNACVKFYENIIKFPRIKKMLGDMSPGGAGRNRVLNQTDFYNKLYVPYTSRKEQEKIAEILSCCDKVIELKEKTIEEKYRIKNLIIQNELKHINCNNDVSGKYIKLGTCVKFYKSKELPKEKIVNNGVYPCIHYGQLFRVYGSQIKNIISYTNENDEYFMSQEGDVLMPTSDVTPTGLATASCINLDNVILGGDILIIRPNKKMLNGNYLSYVIASERKQILKLVTGVTVYHIYSSDMKNFKFWLPNIKKQENIVNKLSQCDKEIELLKQELEQYKQLKKSLSQLLLTGIVRVNEV